MTQGAYEMDQPVYVRGQADFGRVVGRVERGPGKITQYVVKMNDGFRLLCGTETLVSLRPEQGGES